MAAWNSGELEVVYYVLGWIAFCSWAICFYPQLILNFRRKSVVGLNFDFVGLSLTKHVSYLIYNASLFFSSSVQRQYHQKFGFDQMISVAANDVAFSIYAVLLTALMLFQIVKWYISQMDEVLFDCENTILFWNRMKMQLLGIFL